MKIYKFIPLILLLLGLGIGYGAMTCGLDRSCAYYQNLYLYALPFFQPLWIFCAYSLPLAVLILFVPRVVFKNLMIAALAWVIFSAYYIAATPVWDSELISFSRSDAARVLPELFTAMSILFVAWTFSKHRRETVSPRNRNGQLPTNKKIEDPED